MSEDAIEVEMNNSIEPVDSDLIDSGHLTAFIERIERLEEEKAGIAQDVKDVYGEAKANGFDTKILKQVIRLRKMDRDARKEEQAILDLYLSAIGMD